MLGVFTFLRVVECGAEDFRYGVAINRIRINSVVGGSAVAIALGALASLAVLLRHADRLLEQRTGQTESTFPSPT